MQNKEFFFHLIFFLGSILSTIAQINPPDKSTINYTQILFEYNEIKDADYYVLEVTDSSKFSKGFSTPKISQKDNSTASLITGLSFGKNYKWRVTAFSKNGQKLNTSVTYTFKTGYCNYVDTSKYRLRINKQLVNSDDKELIWLDYLHIAVNRKGVPVWFLEEQSDKILYKYAIRYLTMSPTGSITLLTENDAFDIDLNGEIIWEAPNNGKVSGEKKENYHHDFKKLNFDKYVVLGQYTIRKRFLNSNDTTLQAIEYNTIIEYNKNGEITWFWNSKDYFNDEDLLIRKNNGKTEVITPHMNAFSVDSTGEFLYAGFRDLSLIVKIRKATKEVIACYGSFINKQKSQHETNFFKKQHDANILKNGNIAVFNNDSVSNPGAVSSIVVFNQYSPKNNHPKKTWELKLNFDSLSDGKSIKFGNVTELKNQNFLACAGTLSRIFEVNQNKKIVWDSFSEQFDTLKHNWTLFPIYRASYSSSLYPYYFTTKSRTKTLLKNESLIQFDLINEGTEDDNYAVEILGTEKQLVNKKIIFAKKESRTKINMKINYQKNMLLRITSLKSGKTSSYTL